MRWYIVTHGRGSEGDRGVWSKYPVSVTQLQNIAHPAQCQCYQLMCTTWLSQPPNYLDTSISQKDEIWFLPVLSYCNCSILVKWLPDWQKGMWLWVPLIGLAVEHLSNNVFLLPCKIFSLRVKLQCVQLKGCFRIIILSEWGHLQTGECCNSFKEFLRTVTLLMKIDWFWKICLTTVSFLPYSAFCVQIS